MSRAPILGRVHPDVVCAVALAIIEDPLIVVNLEAVTVLDGAMQPLATVRNWLKADDPLDVVTREYLQARREATMSTPSQSKGSWASATAAKARTAANEKARLARDRGRALLAERGVLVLARQNGLRIIGMD